MHETKPTFHLTAEQRKILLIEDEAVNQEILKMYLADTYDVIVAGTGKEALEIIFTQSKRLSLILLDLNLPDIHGSDILRQIKADSRSDRLPVIVMTSDSESEVECLSLGASDFIPKPYPRQQVVLARILRTIELYEDRDTLRWTERDQLTGLYNKEFFYLYATQLDTNHPDEPADAIMLNINHFHIINDRYGKLYGDQVLRLVADKAQEFVEQTGGIASRSEADTFLIYCPHLLDYDAFLETITGYLNKNGQKGNRVRLRMGVYAKADKALDIERRFDRAKLAADSVKDSVTRVIGLYDGSMHEKELLAEQMIEDFPTAIRERQFQVYYQPKFDIRSNEPILVSAEALIRWKYPHLGMVSPGVFVPLFENNGLIQTLDQYVWCEAAKQVRDWKERLGISLPVSINISRIDLYDPLLVDKLEEIIRQNDLRSEDLLLEITESAYTENSDQIISTVKMLQKLGFRIEMDDFGTGYSSLGMLSKLPIDALKLDMSFVRSAFGEKRDVRMIELILDIAKYLRVPVVAEGVETEEQYKELKAMGCDLVQGYYFSKPVPPESFERFLKEKAEAAADGALS
jgi:diguanylate cyclase (GGDEF)-like protein